MAPLKKPARCAALSTPSETIAAITFNTMNIPIYARKAFRTSRRKRGVVNKARNTPKMPKIAPEAPTPTAL